MVRYNNNNSDTPAVLQVLIHSDDNLQHRQQEALIIGETKNNTNGNGNNTKDSNNNNRKNSSISPSLIIIKEARNNNNWFYNNIMMVLLKLKIGATMTIILSILFMISFGLNLNNHSNQLQRHNHENIPANKTIRRDELPTFVLHVGPQKSGTTTIQKELHAPHMKQLLRQDNFTVIDDDIIRKKHLNFLTTTSNGTIFEFPKDFVKVVEKQRKVPGQNIFGSSEYLRVPNDRQCQAWNNMFMSPVVDEIDKSDGQKWNLHVVITYRRLHSYLPSGWNQEYKLFRINRRPVHLHHQNWPGVNGDYRIPSFDEWFVEKHYGQSHHLHLAQERYSAWKKCSDEIIIVNIHDLNVHGVDSDLTTNFVCKALKGATRTCSSLLGAQSNNKRLLQKNKSINLDHDILAVYAYENELIGVDPKHAIDNALYKRDHVTLKVQEHVDSNGIALPMKCPNSTVLDYIYDWSLKSEQWAFSVMQNHNANSTEMGVLHQDVIEIQPLTKERLSNFNNDWEKSLAEKKFCNVDFVETLKQKEWQKFFRNLSY